MQAGLKTKLEEFGQVYVLGNVIESISLGNSSFSNDVYPQAVLVKSYGVNARFHDACRNTDTEVFGQLIEDLRKLEVALSK